MAFCLMTGFSKWSIANRALENAAGRSLRKCDFHTTLLCLDRIGPFDHYCPNKGIQNICQKLIVIGPLPQNNS